MPRYGYCRKCGESLQLDPDGGWCASCEDYWDNVDLENEEE